MCVCVYVYICVCVSLCNIETPLKSHRSLCAINGAALKNANFGRSEFQVANGKSLYNEEYHRQMDIIIHM